ncbi:MAG: hypothetical protein IPJ36_19335 [Simplicispira sp.]|nr:hypothetical protein [Simplicispira sp.]
MDRCPLKGELGDSVHAVLCAAGYNIRWLLRMIAKKGVLFFAAPLFAPVRGDGCVGALAADIARYRLCSDYRVRAALSGGLK